MLSKSSPNVINQYHLFIILCPKCPLERQGCWYYCLGKKVNADLFRFARKRKELKNGSPISCLQQFECYAMALIFNKNKSLQFFNTFC